LGKKGVLPKNLREILKGGGFTKRTFLKLGGRKRGLNFGTFLNPNFWGGGLN